MYLKSIASAVPPFSFTQADCLKAFEKSAAVELLRPRSRALMERILSGDSGIDTRNFCLPEIKPVFDLSATQLNALFENEAPKLAARALEKALGKASLKARDLDALIVCTCTGYLCPGVSSHVAERLGLRSDAFLQDIVGLGCGAAIPTLRSARGFIAAEPDALVATVAVEICSAAFYVDDDPGVLISLCLFGDGASAAIWTGEGEPDQWRVARFDTVHRPEQREKIRFVNAEGKLRNQLDRAVPEIAAEAARELFERSACEPDRIISHCGGRDVVDALESVLPLELAETREILRRHGNISSPSVLFTLEERMNAKNDADAKLWLLSFGAGFAAHSCELSREK